METQKDRQLLAVVFTDIQGFSALTQTDERKALQIVTRYREVVTQQTQVHHGQVIHFYGDGSLSVHASAIDAVRCAIGMQQAFAGEQPIAVRVGIHLGDIVITGDTVYGNAVNIASRLQHLATAHSILISGSVAEQLGNHPEISTTFITDEYVKNIQEAIHVHAIVHPDLVTPHPGEVRARGVTKKRKPYVVIVVAILVIAAYFLTRIFDLFPKSMTDQQILVLPFKNKTGDSTLENFSLYAAAYISRKMEEEEKIKVVSARDILFNPNLKAYSTLSYGAISNKTNARNFIDGHYLMDQDGMLILNAGLIDGKSGSYIRQFGEQVVNPDDPNPGLVKLIQEIVGFLISTDYVPLTTPTKEAFNAYIEALRVYGVNEYQDSRQHLLDAIHLDSTFIDAYFILSDTYHNARQYAKADSTLAVIKKRFPVTTQSARQRNSLYFYEAFAAGNNPSAYKYLLNDYYQNPKDLFKNTTAASFAMYFLNAPKEANRILRKIPAESIDYEFPDQQFRLSIGIQANCDLGRYRRAVRLAELYPSRDMTLDQHRMRIRAFAGVKDTMAIQNALAYIALNFDTSDYVKALYYTAQQFALLRDETRWLHYLNRTFSVINEHHTQSAEKALTLYDLGRYREGLEHAKFLHSYAPTYAPYVGHLGRGYALAGMPDSARYACAKLRELLPAEAYRGQISYLEATIYTALQDFQTALIKLQNAVDEGLVFYEGTAAFDPRLMPLFDKPEFQEIIHPLGRRSR